MGGGVWVQLLGVTLCLVLPALDDTGSLGSPPHQVDYPPVSTLVTASCFLGGIGRLS